MKIEPESWRILSPLLDQWLELPEELRAGWMENLGPEHAGVLPVLRQLIATQAAIDDKRLSEYAAQDGRIAELRAGHAFFPT